MQFIDSYHHLLVVTKSVLKSEYSDINHLDGHKGSLNPSLTQNQYQALKLGHIINASILELQRLIKHMLGKLTRTDTCIVFDFTAHSLNEKANIDLEMRAGCQYAIEHNGNPLRATFTGVELFINKGQHR